MDAVEYMAIQGCVHGDLRLCYDEIRKVSRQEKRRISCVLWSGDVQTVRDLDDLNSVACPAKYRKLKDFREFYEENESASCTTVFIGGNHESSNFLSALYLGGWVAPNIFYLGRSGVVWVKNRRIAGLSGIYNDRNYHRGFFETKPFTRDSIRSVYHVREHDVLKLKKIPSKVDILMTHDWPAGIVTKSEDIQRLIRKKPYFKDELLTNNLGNPKTLPLLNILQPDYWVAAHLHVTYECTVETSSNFVSRFIAHDKPKSRVSTSLLSIDGPDELKFDVRGNESVAASEKSVVPESSVRLAVDAEWLWILKAALQKYPTGGPQTSEQDFIIEYQLSQEKVVKFVDQLTELLTPESPESVKRILEADSTSIPLTQLSKIRFLLPDWTELNFRDPDSQTRWWFRLLNVGLPKERNCLLEDSTPPPPAIALNLEEESLSL